MERVFQLLAARNGLAVLFYSVWFQYTGIICLLCEVSPTLDYVMIPSSNFKMYWDWFYLDVKESVAQLYVSPIKLKEY
eukprot:scaffold13298_cov170-Skeletonema_menzelii.AAC.3